VINLLMIRDVFVTTLSINRANARAPHNCAGFRDLPRETALKSHCFEAHKSARRSVAVQAIPAVRNANEQFYECPALHTRRTVSSCGLRHERSRSRCWCSWPRCWRPLTAYSGETW